MTASISLHYAGTKIVAENLSQYTFIRLAPLGSQVIDLFVRNTHRAEFIAQMEAVIELLKKEGGADE